ncbi:MAG: hypothetical protein MZV64_24890 [Ignavibacteriales bacterium]|nr:hypothetical protein [Ignavibacteriales bacterium]
MRVVQILCIKALTIDESNIPVELTSFTAINKRHKNYCSSGSTATETNNHQFEIYRRDINDGKIERVVISWIQGRTRNINRTVSIIILKMKLQA